jgi:hypothetical protein
MTRADKARAKKLFAMLQSPYESEVLAATCKLKELLAEHGMTINDLVAGNVDRHKMQQIMPRFRRASSSLGGNETKKACSANVAKSLTDFPDVALN